MAKRGERILSKAEVMMNLHLARLNRTSAASLAGVSRRAFFRAMRTYRVAAPKPQWRLEPTDIPLIRQLCGDGLPRHQVAAKFNVHVRTIDKVMSGATWVRR